MPIWKQRLFARLHKPAGDDGSDTSGTGTPPADGATPPADGGTGTPPADAGGGAKKPSDEEARLLKEVMQKKDALKKTGEDLLAAQARLKDFDGIDPVAVRQLLADKAAAETSALEAAGEWSRLKERMSNEHTSSTKALKDEIVALQSQLASSKNSIDDLSIGAHFGQSAFISGELVLTPSKARVVYGNHFDLVDGKVVGFDKPRGESNRTALVDQYGNSVDFDAAMRKIVDADPDKDHMLKSKVKPGAGSNSKPNADIKKPAQTNSISKISAGLAGLKLGV